MLKGYIVGWKVREKPEEHKIDYWFDHRAEKAAYWPTRQEAENDCAIFDYHCIVIPSAEGGTHVCNGFKVEERAPGEFVVFCLAPFIVRDTISGESAPISEMERLHFLVNEILARIEERKQEIIDRGAKEGKTVEIEALRGRLEDSKTAYAGPDRDACAMEVDRLLSALTAKYGTRVPIDHAYKIMQDLDAGRGYTPND